MVETEELDLFPVETGIPYLYTGRTARVRTVRKSIKRAEQEHVSLLDTWAVGSYDDYEWLQRRFTKRDIDEVQERECVAKRLSYLRALEYGLRARTKDGARR